MDDNDRTVRSDERTPLLEAVPSTVKRTPTPLPKLQIAIALLLQVCEPITSQSIYPYINAVCSVPDFDTARFITDDHNSSSAN